MKYRTIRPDEYRLLKDFLYEAIYIPEGTEAPDRSITEQPELALYYKDFGSGPADRCIVAEEGCKRVSLSVQKANFAVSMYKHAGFRTVAEKDDEYLMVCELI